MQQFLSVALPLAVTVTTSTATLPFSNYKMDGPPPSVPEKTATREVAPEPKETRLICKGCNHNESLALAYFQEVGIRDRNSLAAIMGNIKQESNFHANICEGGSRVSYNACRYGGYGLIQWTSTNRYIGLGSFANRYGGDPSSLHTQLRYLTNETQWKRIESAMRVPGKSIERYMNYAYSWIGWGIHGARTHYAYNYLSRFEEVSVA